jgi:2-dehydropantoate 2-reductase
MSALLGAERVTIVGAGSLGSVYGGLLARAGHDVQLLAREPHARAVQDAGGLRLGTAGGDELVPLRADWRPERIEPAEIAIVLTQAPDTVAALEGLDHVRDALRLAVSLQNSVEKDEVLRAWCGDGPVVGGVSMVGGTLVEPGYARHTFDRATVVGELPTGSSPRVERFAELLRDAGLSGVVSRNVLGAEWAKVIHSAPVMALAALTRMHLHELLLSPELAPLYVRLAREGAAVAEAAGIELDDGPLDFPLCRIVAAENDDAVALVRGEGRRMEEAGMTRIRVSMLQSVERGRRTEVETVHGFVVREAERRGVPVPVSELFYSLLKALDRSGE